MAAALNKKTEHLSAHRRHGRKLESAMLFLLKNLPGNNFLTAAILKRNTGHQYLQIKT